MGTDRRRKRVRRLTFIVLLLVLGALLNSKFFLRVLYPLPYKEIIFSEAARNNIDPHLIAAVIKVESNFNPAAESIRGARGIMQIMPETGSWAAEKMNLKGFHPDELFQIETNIKIGCWYLNNLNDEFKGNKVIAIAAYNGGRGNVNQWLTNEQWTGEQETVEQIPFKETREYVKKVMKSYSRYRYLYGDENEARLR